MPAIAAVGIFAGGSALATGALTAFQTIAAIGSIVGGIGALTGNKTLMKVGAVAGLAGGIGAFAQSQGWIASGSAGSALGDAANNTAAMANTSGAGVEAVTPTVDAGTTGLVDSASGAAGGVEAAASAGAQTGGIEGMTSNANITQASPLVDPAAGGGGLYEAGGASAGPTLGKAALDGTNAFGANSAPGAFNLADAPGAGISGAAGNLFGKLGDFAKKIYLKPDGSLNSDMIKLTGDFVGGYFDEYKDALTDYREAEAEQIKRQTANGSDVPNLNIRAGGHVRFRRGRPIYNAPRAGGLMNAR